MNGQIDAVSEQLDVVYTLDNMPRLIERTRDGLRRIERIVKDLRLFARVDEGEWNEVDLNPGIESSVNMVQGYARKKGVVSQPNSNHYHLVRCRAARIHQVVVNLLMNGIDACCADGTVTIRTRSEGEGQAVTSTSETTVAASNRRFANGSSTHSSPPKPSAKVLDWGYRSATGLCRSTTERSRSNPSPGAGSCFRVRLPREPQTVAVPQGYVRATAVGSTARHIHLDEKKMKLGLINSAWVQAGRGTAFGIEKPKGSALTRSTFSPIHSRSISRKSTDQG